MHRLAIALVAASLAVSDGGHDDDCALFRDIAEQLEASRNLYLGGELDREIRASLGANPDAEARVRLLMRLSERELIAGDVDAALEHARKAVAKAQDGVPDLVKNARLALATAHMREAEVENCIARHNRECCIFPLEGGGVHEEDGPARRALEIFVDLAQNAPENLPHLWLANVMAMAVGEHPDALPEALRIPSSAFDSEHALARFVDVAPELGVDVVSLCGGSILEDLDGDRRLDILASNSDPEGPLSVFRNVGEEGFADHTGVTDTACQLGGLNCISADYDGDGDADVLVLRGAWLREHGRIRNSLLRNEGGGRFTDVTHEAGVAEPAYPTQTAAFGDFDGDGDLDLYIGNENVGKDERGIRISTPAQLFMNDGDGTFTLSDQAANKRFAKGVAAGDADNDGDLDIYASNRGANRLYENDGEARFADVAAERGVEGPRPGFATWFFDWNNDGRLDIFVAAYDAKLSDIAAHYLGREDSATRPALYENQGGGVFEDIAAEAGLDRPFLPMGANFGDVDGDGWLDIYLATGGPPWRALMPNVLLRNDRAQRFRDATRSAGVGHLQKGHGVSFADVDEDGDQDLFHQLGGFYRADAYANALFANPGHGGRFLYVSLEGRQSNRQGIGVRIRVVVETDEGEREIHRAAGSVSSFGSTPFRQEIGLGSAKSISALEVWWPTSDTRQRFEDVELDTWVLVVEGEDEPGELELRPAPLGG